jgi:hypothetical protein
MSPAEPRLPHLGKGVTKIPEKIKCRKKHDIKWFYVFTSFQEAN